MFLVRNCPDIDDDDKTQMLEHLQSDTSGAARNYAAKTLDDINPGTSDRLRSLWTAYGRQSLFLFTTPGLSDWTSSDARRYLARLIEADGGLHTPGTWHVFKRPVSDPDRRVHKADMSGDIMSTIVRMKRSITVVREEEEVLVDFTYDVQVVIDFSSPAKLTRIFGAQSDGRKSLRTVLQFLGISVPDRGRNVSKYMTPVSVTEPKLRALAEAKNWEWVDVNGEDAAGSLGRVGYSGKSPNPYRRTPLDMNDQRVKAQDSTPNDSRTYNFQFSHLDDGYEEISEAEFLFGVRQTRIGFPRRATRPAMDHVVSLVYALTR